MPGLPMDEARSRSEVDHLLAHLAPPLHAAEVALHNGDAGPRTALWSATEPVTLFGADYDAVGVDAARQVFQRLATQFTNCTEYDVELVAADASGDLAYTVVYERAAVWFNGVATRSVLRVTQVYRREEGAWRVVHRHGDRVPHA